jgi:tetratricopeptide (TPR) repeat protein
MQIPVKKINIIAFAVGLPLSVLGAPNASAQNAAPAPAPAAAPAPPPTDAQTIKDGIFHEQTDEGSVGKGGADILGTMNDKLKAIDVLSTPALDNAAVGERFKTYLGLQAVPDDRIKAYFGQMNQVTDLLKNNSTANHTVFPAWKILYSMSDYTDLDAGISRELAHRIEAIWNSGKTQNGLELANSQLRDKLDTDIHNSDQDADDLHQQDLQENAKSGGHGGGGGQSSNSNATNSAMLMPNADPVAAEASMLPQMSGALQRKMELTDDYLKTLEERANIKLNEIREHRMDAEDQADFAAYIKTLYDSHRYYHVIIAADFYRAMFDKDEYPVDMQDEVNKALEINQQVSQNVEVFKYDASGGKYYAASTELQGGFMANEFHPALQGLDRDAKEKVGDLLTKLNVLKNQIEVRDFELVDGQIAAIQKIASDFDATKPEAMVNDIKLSSRLRLDKAKLLAQQGELTEAMKEFQAAAEEWPGNPALQTASDSFFGKEDVKNQSTDDFDRLVTDQNYREIFAKQLAFAPAVHGDPKREQELKDALVKVQKAEMASEKANMLVMSGDVDGAWETVEAAVNDWPDDVKLNKMLASLSTRCADFVSAINKARDAESKKEYGYSLTWYVNAESYYPSSTIANNGIDEVSKEILASAGNKTASTQD